MLIGQAFFKVCRAGKTAGFEACQRPRGGGGAAHGGLLVAPFTLASLRTCVSARHGI
jgi:hypothetical protein